MSGAIAASSVGKGPPLTLTAVPPARGPPKGSMASTESLG